MQDGAMLHRTQEVFRAIQLVYGTQVIGLGYTKFANVGLEWQLYSPDINPCDCFLWGYIKEKCYAENPTSKEDLIKAIKKMVYGITTHMLEKIFYSFRKRINFRAQSNGSHFEYICH